MSGSTFNTITHVSRKCCRLDVSLKPSTAAHLYTPDLPQHTTAVVNGMVMSVMSLESKYKRMSTQILNKYTKSQ